MKSQKKSKIWKLGKNLKNLLEFYKTKDENQPNYLVAIDTRDRINPQFIYTPDENLQLLTNVRVIHPNLEEYFEHYDGNRYSPRPWLQAMYPKDWYVRKSVLLKHNIPSKFAIYWPMLWFPDDSLCLHSNWFYWDI